MPQIRPVSDLRNSFAEISRVVHQSDEPELGISAKLREAEIEAETTQERFLHEDVMADLRQKLKAVNPARV